MQKNNQAAICMNVHVIKYEVVIYTSPVYYTVQPTIALYFTNKNFKILLCNSYNKNVSTADFSILIYSFKHLKNRLL